MRVNGSLMRILLLISFCVLRMYLLILGPYTCLYQSQKWHACMFRTMKGVSSLSLLVKETNCQLYLAEAGLKSRYLENHMMTWNPRNSFITHS